MKVNLYDMMGLKLSAGFDAMKRVFLFFFLFSGVGTCLFCVVWVWFFLGGGWG